jgi:hypothetical protein
VPFPPIDEQVPYLKKGLAEPIREQDSRERQATCVSSGLPLRAQAGFNPPAPDSRRGRTAGFVTGTGAARATEPRQMVSSGEHTLRLGKMFCRVVVA